MENKIRNKGELNLAGMVIPCYVLENGIRVLSGRGMQEALKMVDDNSKASGHRISDTLLKRHLNRLFTKIKTRSTLNR